MTDLNEQWAVIFDLDGVLVNTGPFHRQAWYDLAEKENLQMSDELFYSTFGMQNYLIIPKLVGKQLPRDEIDRMSDWKEQRYRDLVAGKLQLLEGVEPLLENLKQHGFALAIGTSTPRTNLDFMFKYISLTDFFDAYVTGEEIAEGKPAPDTFLKAAEKLSLSAGRCVVVEDAVAGIQAAKAAGMAVIAVTNTTERDKLKQADLVVDSLTELDADNFITLIDNS